MQDILVNEFSREFTVAKAKNGELVSGGYKSEVGPSVVPVPSEIEKSVKKGDFQIRDSYGPKKGEYALIARTISAHDAQDYSAAYSVLAVATMIPEDGNRPTIGYRYFWLKNDTQVAGFDGIGTLLEWWHKVGRPTFSFNSNTSQQHSAEIYLVKSFQKYHDSWVEQYISDIETRQLHPFAFVKNIDFNSDLTERRIHALTLYLYLNAGICFSSGQRTGTYLSWAYNVNDLKSPNLFDVIAVTNEGSLKMLTKQLVDAHRFYWVSEAIEQQQSQHQQYIHDHSPTYAKSMQAAASGVAHRQSSYVYQEPLSGRRHASYTNPSEYDAELAKAISDLARNRGKKEKNLSFVKKMLEIDTLGQVGWEGIRNQQMWQQRGDIVARYKALWYLLNPNESVGTWLLDLRPSQRPLEANQAIEIQESVIDYARKTADALDWLGERLYEGVDELVYRCVTNPSAVPSDDVVWLLKKSDSAWQDAFDSYAKDLVKRLVLVSSNASNATELLTEGSGNFVKFSMLAVEKYLNQEQQSAKVAELNAATRLFSEVKNYPLAIAFAQIGGKHLSKEILREDPVGILESHVGAEALPQSRYKKKGRIEIIFLYRRIYLSVLAMCILLTLISTGTLFVLYFKG